MRGYFPLIRNDSIAHMHGHENFVNEGLSFPQDVSLENSEDSYLYFRLALLHSMSFLLLFPLSLFQSFLNLCVIFAFEDFDVHHKDWVTHSIGTDRPGELCHNFSLSNDFTQTVNLPNQVPDTHRLVFWIYFFILTLVFLFLIFFLHIQFTLFQTKSLLSPGTYISEHT